ncbi:MAG: ThiF family adenylyltransferase [Chitinophagaceae bacterium]
MSAELLNHSPDLKRLRDEGYSVEIREGHLLVHDVPYVTAGKSIAFGTLVSVLTLANSQTTAQPDNHVCYFIGEFPSKRDGMPITGIRNQSQQMKLSDTITIDHRFSARPDQPYRDYYEKMTTYISILTGEAQAIDPDVKANMFRFIESKEEDSVFGYLDTNSSRAGILPLNDKIKGQRIAIIGLGGTGAYVLDLLAKCPVAEIHMYDGDLFLQHNSYRAPGAATPEDLKAGYTKVAYYLQKYGIFHKGIVAHPVYITEENVDELGGYDFIFICIDKPSVKQFLFRRLVEMKVPFVDTGMDVERVDGSLVVMLRVTTASAGKYDHLPERVSFADIDGDREYRDNIQIAELNMANAAMAVLRWKRMFGFYADLNHEFHTLYSVNSSQLANHDIAS